jgi:hypothetical protein
LKAWRNTLPLSPSEVAAKLKGLKEAAQERDSRMADIKTVRGGTVPSRWQHLVSQQFPEPVVANFIDVAARDLAESSADMPTITCSSSNMVSDAAKKRADKRTKIAQHYVASSRLDVQMPTGADHYYSYGLEVIRVEPDFEKKSPHMQFEDPTGGYPEFDRWGRTVSYTKVVVKSIDDLVGMFPEFEMHIKGNDPYCKGSAKRELVRYSDKDQELLFLPECKNLILRQAKSATPGYCSVVAAKRGSLDEEIRGQFDDVIPVQMARGYFAALAIEAAEKAVQAPLAIPDDVDEISFGGDALLKTNSPEKIRRVGVDVPTAAFAEMATLEQEQRVGSRYPEARTGNLNASVVTGQGVDALMAGYNSQIAIFQRVLANLLSEAIGLCFLMDQHLWPDRKKTIRGVQDGAPFELDYTPAQDINGDYTVDIQFGMLGMDKNRALVFLLQALGAGLVSKSTVMRELPIRIDVVQEEQQRVVEGLREALLQGIAQLPAAIPMLASQGQDPSQMVKQVADIIAAVQKGSALEAAVEKVFAPPPPPPTPDDLMATDQAAAQQPGGAPPGPPGAPPGADMGAVNPSQPGGGAPPLQMLLAGSLQPGNPATRCDGQSPDPHPCIGEPHVDEQGRHGCPQGFPAPQGRGLERHQRGHQQRSRSHLRHARRWSGRSVVDTERRTYHGGPGSRGRPRRHFRFSILGCFIDVADAFLGNLKAHHNHRLHRRILPRAGRS